MTRTTAPWVWQNRYEDKHGKGDMLLGNGGKGTYVCHLYVEVKGACQATTNKWQAERMANQRLIAAAPELLEALEQVIFMVKRGFIHNKHECIDRAREAVAKASEPTVQEGK